MGRDDGQSRSPRRHAVLHPLRHPLGVLSESDLERRPLDPRVDPAVGIERA